MRVNIVELKHIKTIEHYDSNYIELYEQKNEIVKFPIEGLGVPSFKRKIYKIFQYGRRYGEETILENYAISIDQTKMEIPFLDAVVQEAKRDTEIKYERVKKELDRLYKDIDKLKKNFVLIFFMKRIFNDNGGLI